MIILNNITAFKLEGLLLFFDWSKHIVIGF